MLKELVSVYFRRQGLVNFSSSLSSETLLSVNATEIVQTVPYTFIFQGPYNDMLLTCEKN
jgi:hypothetical protein